MKCPFLKKIKVINTKTVGSFTNWTEMPIEYAEEFQECIKDECMAYIVGKCGLKKQ